MTNLNDTNPRRELTKEAEGSSFTGATWLSLGFILALFGGVAFWAYQSGDMQEVANNRPGVERKMPPATTGQSAPTNPGAPSAPVAKDTAK
ncbi:MAG: hypothetical protein K2Y71_16280 [Xanthobacteraceae bacterium]|nr:hypothetical protein [Xanthobacteraceae bacterium]